MLLSLAGIVVAGAVAQWLAWRLRLPAILLLLATGLALGPGLGVLNTDHLFGDLLLPGISLGVAVILFEGGLGLRFRELHGVRVALVRLLTVGVAITFGGVAAAAHYVLGLDWPLALALGAILTVTGPTVVGPLLRDIRLTGRVGTLLRWEGIVIDPMGALLAAVVILFVRSGAQALSPLHVVADLAGTVVVGAGLGLLGGGFLVLVMRRYWAPDRLQNPISLAVVLGVYALADHVYHDAGLIAVTVMGMALANQRVVAIKHVVEFKESLVAILLAALFVVLGSRIRPADILNFGWSAVAFALCLVLLIRPLAIAASTIATGLSARERGFLAGMAPRGVVAVAIASVFALELSHAGVPGAPLLLSATVLSVIGTVSVYGLSARWLARQLGLVDPNPQGILFVGACGWVRRLARAIKEAGGVVTLIDTDWRNVADARMLGLTVAHGSALSEQLIEELDTSRLRRVVATTPNAELNALVCQRFAELFGREEVYHLSAGPEHGRHITVAPEQRGRDILTAQWTYAEITQQFGTGGGARATKLTSEFGFADWQTMYGPTALPVFLVRRDGNLVPFTAGGPAPAPGDTVIALHAAKPTSPVPAAVPADPLPGADVEDRDGTAGQHVVQP